MKEYGAIYDSVYSYYDYSKYIKKEPESVKLVAVPVCDDNGNIIEYRLQRVEEKVKADNYIVELI